MFDRIRRAIICLTTSDDAEIRNKLDEFALRRAVIKAEELERQAILDNLRAIRLANLRERLRDFDNTEKYLNDQRRKQKEERKKAAKAQASQKKLRLCSEPFPCGMVPASRHRLVGGQASIDPENETMTQG